MTTPHNHPVVFGRRVAGCPRCAELDAGAPPVEGWGARRQRLERQHREDIRNHNCQRSGCGPVCTFGDW